MLAQLTKVSLKHVALKILTDPKDLDSQGIKV